MIISKRVVIKRVTTEMADEMSTSENISTSPSPTMAIISSSISPTNIDPVTETSTAGEEATIGSGNNLGTTSQMDNITDTVMTSSNVTLDIEFETVSVAITTTNTTMVQKDFAITPTISTNPLPTPEAPASAVSHETTTTSTTSELINEITRPTTQLETFATRSTMNPLNATIAPSVPESRYTQTPSKTTEQTIATMPLPIQTTMPAVATTTSLAIENSTTTASSASPMSTEKEKIPATTIFATNAPETTKQSTSKETSSDGSATFSTTSIQDSVVSPETTTSLPITMSSFTLKTHPSSPELTKLVEPTSTPKPRAVPTTSQYPATKGYSVTTNRDGTTQSTTLAGGSGGDDAGIASTNGPLQNNTISIVVGVVGGLIFLVLLAILIVMLCRRKRTRHTKHGIYVYGAHDRPRGKQVQKKPRSTENPEYGHSQSVIFGRDVTKKTASRLNSNPPRRSDDFVSKLNSQEIESPAHQSKNIATPKDLSKSRFVKVMYDGADDVRSTNSIPMKRLTSTTSGSAINQSNLPKESLARSEPALNQPARPYHWQIEANVYEEVVPTYDYPDVVQPAGTNPLDIRRKPGEPPKKIGYVNLHAQRNYPTPFV